jgi:hypothetical protein
MEKIFFCVFFWGGIIKNDSIKQSVLSTNNKFSTFSLKIQGKFSFYGFFSYDYSFF